MTEKALPQFIHHESSPLGNILLAADEVGLTGLWFEGQKNYARTLSPESGERELPVFRQAKHWLEVYFSGKEPAFSVPLHPMGTAFQQRVWDFLRTIPYGNTVTYGEIAKRLAAENGLAHLSAQAVGGAVGRNPISILIPCHRVIGADGSLTGYAGGIGRKRALLTLEREGVVNAAGAIPQAAQQRSRMRQP